MIRFGTGGGARSLRMSSAANLANYCAAVGLSLLTFRLMIYATSTATVGMWALVLGLAAVARVADLGIGTNVTRFVAGLGDPSRRTFRAILRSVGALSILPVILLSCALAGPIYLFAIGRAGSAVTHGDIAWMVAAAVAAGLLGTVTAVLSSILEGGGQVVIGSGANAAYNVVALACVLPAVRLLGPLGIGLANLAGVAVQTGIVTVLLGRRYAMLPESTDDDYSMVELFRALCKTTVQNFGVILARMALDPLTRLFVARTASLDMLAYFELALRVASQARAAIQAAIQPLLYLGASDNRRLAERFSRPHRLLVTVAGLCLVGMATGAPILSYVVLGRFAAPFLILMLLLALGSMGNLIGAVGYISDAAQGRFGSLLRMTLTMVAVNAVGGGLLTLLLGAYGAVAGYALAMLVGGIYQLRSWAKFTGQTLGYDLRMGMSYTAAAIAAVMLFLLAHQHPVLDAPLPMMMISAALSALIAVPFLHLMRRTLNRPAMGTIAS